VVNKKADIKSDIEAAKANMGYADIRHALYALIATTLAICCACPAATAATPKPESPKRLVIIDQDAFGPAGSNLQAILLLLQTSGERSATLSVSKSCYTKSRDAIRCGRCSRPPRHEFSGAKRRVWCSLALWRILMS